MTQALSKKAKRVQAVLEAKGYAFKVKELPDSTRTAKEAASAIGCAEAQIAKSLVFVDANTDDPILVIASGINRVNVDTIEKSVGKKLIQAKGKKIKALTGFAIGGIPPVGHDTPLFTILDPDLKNHDQIWVAAGTPNAVFQLNPQDLGPLTRGIWIALS